MAFINDEVFDQGLDWAISETANMHICSTDPGGTYATVTGNSLGTKTLTLTATANAATGTGRKTDNPAITDGTVSGTGTATHWAYTNGSDTVIASGALSSSQAVTSGNTWTLSAGEAAVIIRDAA